MNEISRKELYRMLRRLIPKTVIVPDEVHNSLPDNVNSENVYISACHKHEILCRRGEMYLYRSSPQHRDRRFCL